MTCDGAEGTPPTLCYPIFVTLTTVAGTPFVALRFGLTRKASVLIVLAGIQVYRSSIE